MTYGGDLSPKECWEMLGSGAILVDVRTRAEWAYIGLPLLEDGMHPVIGQEWQVFPEMSVDPRFVGSLTTKLEQMAADKNSKICFLCRSGVRSLAAARAMTAHGYPNTYNVSGGFEGDLDDKRHRGSTNGWKAEGLPWHQN